MRTVHANFVQKTKSIQAKHAEVVHAKHMRSALLLFLASASLTAFGQRPIDTALAARCFQEAKWASDDDGGKLWGKPLYGPMIFVDPETRNVVANQADNEGKLKLSDGVWIGVIPKEALIANTATDWAGVHWTMVLLPLPDAPANRTLLMMHECWHRIQETVGLPGARPDNSHLDTRDGRIWLRLEYRALSLALISWGPERTQAITDALVFRAKRRTLFPTATANEDRMDVHEGMAEYSGIRMMGLGDWGRRSYLSGRIKMNAQKPSYPFSFAYETGPAYGLLLDVNGKDWRPKLSPKSSISDLLKVNEGITLPSDIAASANVRASAYSGAQVISEEEAREQKRVTSEKKYRKELIDGPVLVLPMPGHNFTFDPNDTFPMGADGIVFPSTQISDDWGILEVTGGVRVNKAYDTAFVPAPTGVNLLQTKGWKLTLKPGWKLVPGSRKGDFTVAKG